MKKLCAVLGTSVLLVACSGNKAGSEEVALESVEQKASYSIGVQLGSQFKTQQLELDVNALKAGLADVMDNQELRLSQEAQMEAIQAFQENEMKKKEAAFKVVAEANLKEGQEFLAENGKKDGIVTTESGLQYRVIEQGEGAKPTAEDMVTVHYRGTLIDGTEFDSSYARNEPVTFPVNGVIPGWTEALQLMNEGAKWELFIPAELAYGERGTPGPIGPNATLLFEVELIKAKAE